MSTYRVLARPAARPATELIDGSVRVLKAAATSPVLLTAAWSAIRPKVDRSFAAFAWVAFGAPGIGTEG